MLERRSALASARPYVSATLNIAERPGFTLTQVAGLDGDFEAKLSAVVGALPEKVARAQANGGHSIFRICPAQFWIVGPEIDDVASKLQGQCAVTPLTSSRVRIALDGAPAREVLAKLMPVDWDASVFTPGSVALTGLHHTPVTVHCTGESAFDIYVMRTFALDVWEAITDAAREFATHR
jgi:heterotetrameric sarcosine oxidase gamma subunit